MSIVTISDIHIKDNSDESSKLLSRFLEHPVVKKSESVYFLGDIFDLMIGPHVDYFVKYSVFFDGLKQLILSGKNVYFFSGNHDFHLEELFLKFFEIHGLSSDNFFYLTQYLIQIIDGKKIYFSHGDDIEEDNLSYKRYKRVITSKPLNILANKIIPYKLLTFIGENASKISRKNNKVKYENNANKMAEIKKSFQSAALTTINKHSLDYIVCGHSHISDDCEFNLGMRYLNNGYFPHTKSFIHIEKGRVSFIKLRF